MWYLLITIYVIVYLLYVHDGYKNYISDELTSHAEMWGTYWLWPLLLIGVVICNIGITMHNFMINITKDK